MSFAKEERKEAARESGTQTHAFEDLAHPLLPSLYKRWRLLARNPSDRWEDLVQEALPKALRGFATYESGTNFKEWLSDPSIVATWNVANVAQIANAIDAPNGAVDDIVTNSTQKIGTTFFVEPKPDGFNIRNTSYSPLWQVSMAT